MNRKQRKSWIPKQIKNLFNYRQHITSTTDNDSEEIRKQYMKIVKSPQTKIQQKTDYQNTSTIYQSPPDKLHGTSNYLLQKLEQQENEIKQLQITIAKLQEILQDNYEFKEDVDFQLAQTKTNINMVYNNQVMLKDQLDQQQTLLQSLEQMIITDKINKQNDNGQNMSETQLEVNLNPHEDQELSIQNTVVQQSNSNPQETQTNIIQAQNTLKQLQIDAQQPVSTQEQQQNNNSTSLAQTQQRAQFGFQNFNQTSQKSNAASFQVQNNYQQQALQNNQLNMQQELQKMSTLQLQQNVNVGFQNVPQKVLNQANKFGFQQKKQIQIKFDDDFIGANKKGMKQK